MQTWFENVWRVLGSSPMNSVVVEAWEEEERMENEG